MPTNKEKLLHGIRFMAIAFPLIFSGPALLTWLGIPAMRNGNYWIAAISVLVMLAAAYFAVRGLRTILSAFFDGDDSSSSTKSQSGNSKSESV